MNHLKSYKNVLYWAFLLLIIAPKFNLIAIPGMTQGVRLDDILIFSMLLACGVNFKLRKQIWFFYSYTLIITIVGLVNNNNEYHSLRLLSLLRVMEYLVVYSVAKYSMDSQRLFKFVNIVFWIEFFTMTGQFIIGYSSGERSSGTTAGPWEGALLVCLCYIILAHSNKITILNLPLYTIILCAMLYMTSARAQIVAMIIIWIVFLQNMIYPKLMKITFLVSVIFVFTFFLVSIDLDYINFRRSYFYIADSYQEIFEALLNENVVFDRNTANYDTLIYDASLIARIGQWIYYLRSISDAHSSIFAILFGSGPNSAGIHLDGWYIKVFVDFGILGFLFYIFFLTKMLRNYQYRFVGILILVSGLTLDIFWASKFTYLFLISWGVQNRNETNIAACSINK
jgi:hypothetical protein